MGTNEETRKLRTLIASFIRAHPAFREFRDNYALKEENISEDENGTFATDTIILIHKQDKVKTYPFEITVDIYCNDDED